MHEREILLNLKRLYSKDETVALLTKRLADVEFKMGVLYSEVSELLDENESLRAKIKENPDELKMEIGKLKQRLSQSEYNASEWKKKYHETAIRLNRLQEQLVQELIQNTTTP